MSGWSLELLATALETHLERLARVRLHGLDERREVGDGLPIDGDDAVAHHPDIGRATVALQAREAA